MRILTCLVFTLVLGLSPRIAQGEGLDFSISMSAVSKVWCRDERELFPTALSLTEERYRPFRAHFGDRGTVPCLKDLTEPTHRDSLTYQTTAWLQIRDERKLGMHMVGLGFQFNMENNASTQFKIRGKRIGLMYRIEW